MALAVITVGATRRTFIATIVDNDGNVISLNTTASNHKLQGTSRTTSAVPINVSPATVDGPAGKLTFTAIGSLVSQATLTSASADSSDYRLKVKYMDLAGLVDFTEAFVFTFEEDPLQPA
jgi:hypothetical protein